MAGQGAGVLLVAGVGDAGGSVVEELLDVVRRVLEARSRRTGTVHQSVAPADTLGKPTVVVSWLQGLTAFVLGEKRVHKIGTHGSCMKDTNAATAPPPH